jgi:predicted acyl esterase
MKTPNLPSGMVRARDRRSLDKPGLLKHGEVIEPGIKLRPTSKERQRGRRILLAMSSSDFGNHSTAADRSAGAIGGSNSST